MGRRLLFLGPPGAGKGTQAIRLAQAVGVPHISTGDMLRQNVADGTDLGKEAEAIMEAGDLVHDELVVAMVDERLHRQDATCGFVLDGFPRNVSQAEALEARLGDDNIELVMLLDVDEDELVDRLLKRSEDQGRSDDNEESIRNRLTVYADETAPLIEHYPAIDVTVRTVDGVGSVDDVTSRVMMALVR